MFIPNTIDILEFANSQQLLLYTAGDRILANFLLSLLKHDVPICTINNFKMQVYKARMEYRETLGYREHKEYQEITDQKERREK